MFGGNKEFLKKLSGIVKSSSLGCLSDGRLNYRLDVFVSNCRSNTIKNQPLLYSCNLNLCCDKETNLERFLLIYKDILSYKAKDFGDGKGYIHGYKDGVVYSYFTFRVTIYY